MDCKTTLIHGYAGQVETRLDCPPILANTGTDLMVYLAVGLLLLALGLLLTAGARRFNG